MNETDFPPGVRATLIIVMCLGVMLAVVNLKINGRDDPNTPVVLCQGDPTLPDFGSNCP